MNVKHGRIAELVVQDVNRLTTWRECDGQTDRRTLPQHIGLQRFAQQRRTCA